MNWYLDVYKKYADFTGRARRSEYWYFFLFYTIAYIVLSIIDASIGTYSVQSSIGLLGGLYMLASLIPSVAVGIRRLHDTGRSGWWLLIGLIPLIGAIVIIVFFVQDSAPGANQYGPNPKEQKA
jgi:uncharacterized membrane protein YhaH (DUF805 family)